MKCIADGCTRQAKNKKKPGYCNTCNSRRFANSQPLFPAQPLLDFMDARGKKFPREHERPKPGTRITLERMDALCIDVLGVHPSAVYGELYFKECVS